MSNDAEILRLKRQLRELTETFNTFRITVLSNLAPMAPNEIARFVAYAGEGDLWMVNTTLKGTNPKYLNMPSIRQQGQDKEPHHGYDALGWAAKNGQNAVVQALLHHAVAMYTFNAPSPNEAGLVPAAVALKEGHNDIVRTFLRYGYNLEARAVEEATPTPTTLLELAVKYRNVEMVHELLSQGAKITDRSLQMANEYKNPAMVPIILNNPDASKSTITEVSGEYALIHATLIVEKSRREIALKKSGPKA